MKTCAFTGHRPNSFPWKYDETARDCVLLKKVLAGQIDALVGEGVTEWLSGMALGTDHCILPCEGQEVKWPKAEQERYRSILRQADEVVYVSRAYHSDCMLERNRYMVDRASILLAVYNGTRRSGTGMTVNYADAKHRMITIINPITREVSVLNGKL